MAYEYITSFISANYTPAAEVPAKYGQPRTIKSITIHHWGDDGQTFQGVAQYLCRPGGNTSTHYVAQAGKVAGLVEPMHAAWHAGTADGNATSIGIECRPEATDGDYRTVAELVSNLRSNYGKVPMVRHSDWKPTACPGRWDLNRIERIIASEFPSVPTSPISKEEDMKIIVNSDTGRHYVWSGNTKMYILGPAHLNQFIPIIGQPHWLAGGIVDAIPDWTPPAGITTASVRAATSEVLEELGISADANAVAEGVAAKAAEMASEIETQAVS